MRVVLFYILIPLLLFVLAFYVWGKSSNLSQEELHRIEVSASPLAQLDTITVMTYNLGYLSGMTNNQAVKPSRDLFDQNQQRAIRIIEKYNPEIIGFQEIDFFSKRSYFENQAENLGNHYATKVRSVNWDKKYVPFPYWPPSVHFGKMISGQAIFSKFQVNSSERIVLPGPKAAPFYYRAFYLDRLIQIAQLSIGKQNLVVMNVHLEAFDEQTRELQAKEVMSVLEAYAQQYPVLLMGDFNARPPFASERVTEEQTMQLFFNHPLLSSAISKDRYLSEEHQHFTFDTQAPYEKLDYIFYTKNFIRPVAAATISEAAEISDHLPVSFTFTLFEN
jgi:endonuclease/exonuclease/phosphatase family metal-dependent hydrolase